MPPSIVKIKEKIKELQQLNNNHSITYESRGIKVVVRNNNVESLLPENYISSEHIKVVINEAFNELASSKIQLIQDFIGKQDEIMQSVLNKSFQ